MSQFNLLVAKLKSPESKALIRSYFRHAAGLLVGVVLIFVTDLAPQYAVPIAAAFGPAMKFAQKAEKEFGRRSKKA